MFEDRRSQGVGQLELAFAEGQSVKIASIPAG